MRGTEWQLPPTWRNVATTLTDIGQQQKERLEATTQALQASSKASGKSIVARRFSPHSQGVRLRRHLRPKVIAAQDQIMRTLSKSERDTLLELLTRVVEANQAYARPGNGRRTEQEASV